MHPTLPTVRSSLPGAKAAGRAYRAGARVAEPLSLWGDTLLIDTDQQICSIVWRGNIRVEEAEVRHLRVEVGLELPGVPLIFPEEVASTRITPELIVAETPQVKPTQAVDVEYEEDPSAETMRLPLQEARRPVLPFAPSIKSAGPDVSPAARPPVLLSSALTPGGEQGQLCPSSAPHALPELPKTLGAHFRAAMERASPKAKAARSP